MITKDDINTILQPISDEEPAGRNLMYSNIYNEIMNAMFKNDLEIHVDWKKICALMLDALKNETKDLMIAVWLTQALIKLEGFKGLSIGLKIIEGLIAKFWKRLYPEIKNGDIKYRKVPIEILNKKISRSLRDISITVNAKTLQNILDQLKHLKRLIEDIYITSPDNIRNPPKLNELVVIVTKTKEKVNENITDSTDIQRQQSNDKSIKLLKTNNKLTSKANTVQKIENYEQTIITVANDLRLMNPKNSIPYRLKRMVLWDTEEKFQKKEDDAITIIPFTNKMLQLKEQINLENVMNEAMIELLENSFDHMIWWLDLQHAIVHIMEKIGSDFKKPSMAIRHELKYLIKRFPDISKLKFKNGENFANSKTRLWLKELVSEDEHSEFEINNYLVDKQLHDIIKSRELVTNLNTFSQELRNKRPEINFIHNDATGMKAIFHRRMTAGRLYMEYQQINEAQIIFNSLFQIGKEFNLTQWDPLLFLELCLNYEKSIKLRPEEISDLEKNELSTVLLKLKSYFSTTNIHMR